MKIRIRFEFHIYIHRDGGRNNKKGSPVAMDESISPEMLCDLAEDEARRQRDMLTRSTVENYNTAIRSFRKFVKGKGGEFKLDATLLKRYECWLHDHQVKPNTASCYMRSLRSLFTKIGGDEMRQFFDKVYTGRADTQKRSLSITDITQIQAVRIPPKTFLALVRDLFLFSFYALGMPFVDMAFLRRRQISGGQLTYYRHKTGQQVCMKIEPCMQEIIDRYQADGSDYVFPLLTTIEPRQAYDEYLHMLNRYNRSLKRLAVEAGLCKNLTSYVARHTWASTAFSENVDLAVISKALGHANPRNTLTYIRQIDDQRLNEANQHLIELLQP